MAITNILNGHINELLGDNENLSKKRLSICKLCPLYTEKWYGAICDNNKWMNLETKEISKTPVEGWVNGCMCRLEAKTRDKHSKCKINKW